MPKTSDYNLPDIQLLEKKAKHFIIWIPDKTYIVLGASNLPEESLFLKKVRQDAITVLKRRSGGQAVMLTPNNILIGAVFFNDKMVQPKDVFQNINMLIISAIEKVGINNLSLMGISDIAISGKKVLGSAIYRNKELILYHAVLNLGEPASTFEKYLKHPVKEPDYRCGRKHSDFITSLKDKGYTQSYQHLERVLNQSFETTFS